MSTEVLQYSTTVVIYIGYNNMKLAFLTEGGYTDTIRGRFQHDSLIGLEYGKKVWSQNRKGFAYALRPDPHLFSISLEHKTQILFQADISMVLHLLNLKPGDVVFESGTGSCSLTFSLSKRVASKGQVFTFEFNRGRFENASNVVKQMQLGNVRCHWQNVLENGFVLSEFVQNCQEDLKKSVEMNLDIVRLGQLKGIEFKELGNAVFLDLPSPELVIPHATKVLKKGGRLCSFSPCIEQIQATAKALVRMGYGEIKTVEIIEREMKSRQIGNKRIGFDTDGQGDDSGLFIDQNDQKMHTGFLIFATRI